jgi:hypothetical protein
MGNKGAAGSFIQGFMGSYNKERDRQERKTAADHKREMDASLKNYREVQIAAERARILAEEDKKTADAATAEAIMQRNKAKGGDVYKDQLEEAPTSQAQFMGTKDVEGAPQSMQGFMESGERHRVRPAIGLEGVKLMGEIERAEQESTATAAWRKQTGEARVAEAEARKGEVELRQAQRTDAIAQDKKSREAIRVVLATDFPGLYAQLMDTGMTWDNLNTNGANMIAQYFMAEATSVENDLETMAAKLEGINAIRRELFYKNQAASLKTVSGLSPEQQTIQDVNTMTINDSLNKSVQLLEKRMEALRREQQVQREGETAVLMQEREIELANRQAQIQQVTGGGSMGSMEPVPPTPGGPSGNMSTAPASPYSENPSGN